MARAWYPFYTGDYARKTAHLSLLEHGAYRLLLDHYYSTGLPLPSDPKKLYRICRARSPSERKAVLSVTTEFFTDSETLKRHKKCDSVISKSLEYSNSQSAKAKLRHSHGIAVAQPTTATTIKERKKPPSEAKKQHVPIEAVTLAMVQEWADEHIAPHIDRQYQLLRFQNYSWKRAPSDGVKAFRNWLLKAMTLEPPPTLAQKPTTVCKL